MGGTALAYVSLYRKWRPQSFAEVVGQESIVTTLKNSLDMGRVSHAYLFAGPRGTGKTTVARILAKGLNCEQGPTSTPCGSCGECETIAAGTSLNVIEIDGASNRRIEDVRELRGQVDFTPINARYKVYIIDEVHMLTPEAFNALLKTLEEPPAHVVFIFATTDPNRLPATILSRVQRYDFGRFTLEDIVNRLAQVCQLEGFAAQREALELVAEHAGGSMRDALSILEKCAAFSETITADTVAEVLGIAPAQQIEGFTQALMAGSKGDALEIIDALYNQGKDLALFARSVMARLRKEILRGSEDEARYLQAIETLAASVREMRFVQDPRMLLEVAALRIMGGMPAVPAASAVELTSLEEKILRLEQQIASLQEQLTKERRSPQTAEKPTPARRRVVLASDAEGTAYLLENWPDFLARLRAERLVQCEAFLKEGTPVQVKGDRVIVAFPRDRGFHKASIEQADHRDPTQRVLSKWMGRQVRLECVFQDEMESEPEAAPPAPKAKEPGQSSKEQVDPSTEEFLRASMETFGGKIIPRPKEN
jgi:DNA polymerase-3 subunit gamma/tau